MRQVAIGKVLADPFQPLAPDVVPDGVALPLEERMQVAD